MLLLYCSIISFVKTYHTQNLEGDKTLSLFYGFQQGGNYTIHFTKGNNDYLVLIGTPLEIEEYKRIEKKTKFNKTFDFYSPCNINETYQFDHFHIIKNGNGYASGSIEKEGIYQTLISSCTYFSSELSFDIQYTNPNSTLSSTIQPNLKAYPVIIILTLILFLVWIVNWLCYFSFSNKLHFILTLFLLFNLIDKITAYYNLYLRNKSDLLTQFSSACKLIHSIKTVIFTFCIILTCQGYYICNTQNTFLSIIIILPVSLFYSFSCFYLRYYFKDEDFEAIFVLFVLFLNIILFAVILNKVKSEMQIKQLKIQLFIFSYAYNVISTINEFNFFVNRYNHGFLIMMVFNIFELIFIVFLEIQLRMRNETLNDYISIGGKVTIIKYKDVYYHKSKTFKIQPEIIEIDNSAFKDNKTIQKVEFPTNCQLKKIGDRAFESSSIEHISIPPSVSSIGKIAFSECVKLQSIEFIEKSEIKIFDSFVFSRSVIEDLTIPSSLIDVKSMWCCITPKLTKIKISPENKFFYEFENSMIIQKVKNNFDVVVFAPRNVKQVVIPSFVKRIQTCAFECCFHLKKVDFSVGSQLLSIEKFGFSQTLISSIEIPDSVELIDDGAFAKCSNIKKVVFNKDSKLAIIGKHAFNSDNSLVSFGIPSSVYSIANNAFAKCTNLRFVEIQEDSKLISFSIDLFDECPNVSLFVPHETMLKLFS